MNHSGKILIAAVTGVAAGAALGILFAPGKGSETRKKIAGYMQDKINKYKVGCSDLKEEIEQTFKQKARESL